MKTTPAEATRRALTIKLENVKAVLRQRTIKSSGKKELTLIVSFTVECEGRRANGKMVDAWYDYVIDDDGNKVPIKGSQKDWATALEVPGPPVRAAVLTAIYGTTNVKNDPKSNTAQHIAWKIGRIRKTIAHRATSQLRSKKMTGILSKAERAERRKDMISAMEEVLKMFPEMGKQDLLLAFEEAKKAQVVREVMET